MQGPKKAISIVFTFLIFFAVLAVNLRADGNDKGIGVLAPEGSSQNAGPQESLCRGLGRRGEGGT